MNTRNKLDTFGIKLIIFNLIDCQKFWKIIWKSDMFYRTILEIVLKSLNFFAKEKEMPIK